MVIQLKSLSFLILSQIALLHGPKFCHARKATILIISLQIKLIFRFTFFWFERVYLKVGKYAKGFRMDLFLLSYFRNYFCHARNADFFCIFLSLISNLSQCYQILLIRNSIYISDINKTIILVLLCRVMGFKGFFHYVKFRT